MNACLLVCLFFNLISIGWSAPKKAVTAKPVVAPTPEPTLNHKAQDLSNRLPLDFVEQMTRDGLWNAAFEEIGSVENGELHQFLNALVVGSQFPSDFSEKAVMQWGTSSIKAEFLRYLENAPDSRLVRFRTSKPRVLEAKKRILQKYVEMVLELARMSQIEEYEPINRELRRRLEQNQIQIVDLTPAKRHEWSQVDTTRKLHPFTAHELLEKNGTRYLVDGAYSEKLRILAVDLARPVRESIVTIAHEIIHAADPELQLARAEIRQDFNTVSKLIKEKFSQLKIEDRSEEFLSALMQDVFFEMGRVDIVDFIKEIRENRLKVLNQQLSESDLKDLRTNPVLARLLRNIIRVTVENEYKAYSLSLALYETLKSTYQLVPPSTERKSLLDQHFNHKHSLQATLSFAMNPFGRKAILAEFQPADASQEVKASIQALKSIFEVHYLEQSKVMMAETAEKYKKIFNILQNAKKDAEAEESLPAWTRPGGINSPTHPLQIVAAKISTAQVIRFKQNMDLFLKKMPALQESLLSMTAGILDLHDVSFGEMKLLGLQPPEARAEEVLPSIINLYARDPSRQRMVENLKKDLLDTPQDFLPYFTEMQWSPQLTQNRNQITEAILQNTMMENLYRLRLLKTVHWLRTELPIGKENIISIKAVLAKIFEGHYDREEISTARAQELTKELESYLKAAEVSPDELKKIESYMTHLSQMYFMATESKWQPVAAEFYQRMVQAQAAFENLGFESKLSWAQITQDMQNMIAKFKSSVSTAHQACSQTQKFTFYVSSDLYQLGPFQFPLTALCLDYKLYIFRQPGDYNRAATTWTPYGIPETRIFMNSRPVRLNPFVSFK